MDKQTIHKLFGRDNGIGGIFFATIETDEAIYQLKIFAGTLQGVGSYISDFKRSHPGCVVVCVD